MTLHKNSQARALAAACFLLVSMAAGAADLAEINDGAMPFQPFDFPAVRESADQPIVLGPAGETSRFLQTGTENCGRFLYAKLTVPPHVGPPPHVHHWTDEWFYAPDGGFVLFMGQHAYPDMRRVPGASAPKDTLDVMPMRPKELLYGARYFIHGFVNTSDTPKEMYIVWTPDTPKASILRYFLTAGTMASRGALAAKPDFMSAIRLVTYAPRFGINQSADFWQYVRDVSEKKPDSMKDDHRDRLLKLLNTDGCER